MAKRMGFVRANSCSSSPQQPEVPSPLDSKIRRPQASGEVSSQDFSDSDEPKLTANSGGRKERRKRQLRSFSSDRSFEKRHSDLQLLKFGIRWRRHGIYNRKDVRLVAKSLRTRRKKNPWEKKSCASSSNNHKASGSEDARGKFDTFDNAVSRDLLNEPLATCQSFEVNSSKDGIHVTGSPALCSPVQPFSATSSLLCDTVGHRQGLNVALGLFPPANPRTEDPTRKLEVPDLVATKGKVETGLSLSCSQIQLTDEFASERAGSNVKEDTGRVGREYKPHVSSDTTSQIDDTEGWLTLKPPNKPVLRIPYGLAGKDFTLGLSVCLLPRLFGVELQTACKTDEFNEALSINRDSFHCFQETHSLASFHAEELLEKVQSRFKSRDPLEKKVPYSGIKGSSFSVSDEKEQLLCQRTRADCGSSLHSSCQDLQSYSSELPSLQSHTLSSRSKSAPADEAIMKRLPSPKARENSPPKLNGAVYASTERATQPSPGPASYMRKHPCFSDESSPTEYTSPEPSNESVSGGNYHSVESKREEVSNGIALAATMTQNYFPSVPLNSARLHGIDGRNLRSSGKEPSVRPLGPPPPQRDSNMITSTGAQDLSKSLEHMLYKGSPAHRGPPTGTSAMKGTNFLAQSVPTLGKVLRTPTTKERFEEDANGNLRVVVDLDDSDDDEERLFTGIKAGSPLCSNCHALQSKQKVLHQKALERKEVYTPDMTLVVDLSDTDNGACNVAGDGLLQGEVGTSAEVSEPKVNGKHETRLETSFEHIEIKIDSSRILRSGSRVNTVVTTRAVRKVRKFILADEDEEVRIAKVVANEEDSDEEASTLSGNYKRKDGEVHEGEVIIPEWTRGIRCDLCERGPSLTLGHWYSWCCGAPSRDCKCSSDDQFRKKALLKWKGGKNWTKTDPQYPWSGKVHRLCALWSCEVYEAEGPMRMVSLMSAVHRSKKIKCSYAECGLFGATLGCRVKRCKKNYHYPCADILSVSMQVRMWDGLRLPVACKEHRHINEVCELRETKKKRKRGGRGGQGIDVYSSDEEESPAHGFFARSHFSQSSTPVTTVTQPGGQGIASTGGKTALNGWPQPITMRPPYLGQKLLCADFSNGLEPIMVPCTNDVDDELPPELEYITKSRYQGQPLGSQGCSHPLLKKIAKACKGCAKYDLDDPSAPLSVHIPFERREHDDREDWQKERMYGRLPYDQYARLLVGTDYNELVECNSRCGCGAKCANREMQKGLRIPIEMYKTLNKGWAVRTLVPIPRGRFVIEYVGEMLTQDQAHELGQKYDEIKRSYLYDLDYPESKRKPVYTLDGFHASNVARFINHSCDANLKIYRVYVETTNKWLSHIGMFSMRDIEAGEELSYDYNYGKRPDLKLHEGDDSNGVPADLQHNSMSDDQAYENDSTYIKCYCGAKSCRKWLWRPHYTESDSEEEGDDDKKYSTM